MYVFLNHFMSLLSGSNGSPPVSVCLFFFRVCEFTHLLVQKARERMGGNGQ